MTDHLLEIVVTDPSKYSDSFGSFITYRVITNSNKLGFIAGESIVIRRYSDFSWLANELGRNFPGAIIPPLPEKQTVGRFSPDFVEARRRALEKFLVRIAEHIELSNSETFSTFLQADDVRLNQVKDASKLAKSSISERAGEIKYWFQGTVNSLSSNKVEVENSTADIKIEEMSQYINALEKQLLNVARHSQLLVKRSRDSAATLFEFGQSLTWLGQSEGDAVGAALTQVGSSLDTLSVAATKHAEAEVTRLEEPLEEYCRYTASVKLAILQRAEKKSSYITALQDQEAKQAAHSKLVGIVGKEREEKAKLEMAERAQSRVDGAKLEYEKVSDRLLLEFENFKRQKSTDVRNIIMSFINLQIEYNRMCEEAHTKALQHFPSS